MTSSYFAVPAIDKTLTSDAVAVAARAAAQGR